MINVQPALLFTDRQTSHLSYLDNEAPRTGLSDMKSFALAPAKTFSKKREREGASDGDQ
jgi:hypothetical protein